MGVPGRPLGRENGAEIGAPRFSHYGKSRRESSVYLVDGDMRRSA